MSSTIRAAVVDLSSWLRRGADEAAEGVISTAIAVLILAFVGAAMYVGFSNLSSSACSSTASELESSVGGTVDC